VTTVDSDAVGQQLVNDYLARLTAAGWGLSPARREELVAEVREHIDEASRVGRAEGHLGEAEVRNVLDRLGEPEEIARAAIEQESPAPQAPQPSQPTPQSTNLRDISTVLLLMFGGLLLGIGWVVGVALLWSSPRWQTRDKWLATLVWPFGYAGVFILGGAMAFVSTSASVCTSSPAVRAGAPVHETCTESGFSLPGWVGFLIFLVIVIAPVLVAVRLLRTPTTPAGN